MSFKTDPDSNHIRSAGLLALITSISRLFGLIREVVIAALLGTTGLSDAFTLAFSIPDLLRRLAAEGALVNAFLPTLAGIKKRSGLQRAGEFTGNFIGLFSFILAILSVLLIVFAPFVLKHLLAIGFTGEYLTTTVLLTRIMIGYIILISLTSIYQGVLNSFSIFWVSSLTPALLNISIITTALLIGPHFGNPAIGLALGVIIGGIVQLLFHFPFLWQIGFKIKYGLNWRDPAIRRIFILMAPAIFGMGIYQINIVIGNILASTLQVGSVSSLKFSNRLLELIIGIFVISLTTVVLPRFADLFIETKLEEIRSQLGSAMQTLTFITLPITIGSFFVASDVVALLFARGQFSSQSIQLTTIAFHFHIIGLCFIGWNRMLLICYQALGLIGKLFCSGIIVITLNLVLALWLKGSMGHSGIALSITASQVVHTILLVFFLRELPLGKLALFVNKTNLTSLASTIIMGLGLLSLQEAIDLSHRPTLVRLLILIISGGIIYLASSFLFRNQVVTLLMKSYGNKS